MTINRPPPLAGFALIALLLVTAPARAADDFALRDGDTVVFLGDSITAERSCGKTIENFTLLRFPDRRIRFLNAGWGGDTAAGGLARLERDVLARGATVVIVAYGINDIGWGAKADDAHKQAYLDGIRGIVQASKARGVRVFICSAAATGADPDQSPDDFLQKMCDEGMLIARDADEGAIDVLRTMRQIQKRIKDAGEAEKEKLHVADGIHLNDLGQTAMGYAILKGLHAPAEVSAATIDASKGDVTDKRGCDISNVTVKSNHLEFDRLDSRLPFNQGLFFALRFRFIPFPDELNRYMLTVKGLENGKYAITVDGRGVATFSADDLSAGVNLSSATADGWEPGGPWDAQAWTLAHLTDARNDAEQAAKMHRHYLGRVPGATDLTDPLAAANRALESAQRTAAAPRPYRFVITPTQ